DTADLPDDECSGPRPSSEQPCEERPCAASGVVNVHHQIKSGLPDSNPLAEIAKLSSASSIKKNALLLPTGHHVDQLLDGDQLALDKLQMIDSPAVQAQPQAQIKSASLSGVSSNGNNVADEDADDKGSEEDAQLLSANVLNLVKTVSADGKLSSQQAAKHMLQNAQ